MADNLDREKKTIKAMVRLYCRGQHKLSDGKLCQSCQDLQLYAMERLDKCPFGTEKTTCNKCTAHCYEQSKRQQIRDVMTYSGPRMVGRHPILALAHLLKGYGRRPKQKN